MLPFHRAAWPSALLSALLIAFGAAGARLPAQTTTVTPVPDVATLGPQVGETVPPFTLIDQHGNSRTLDSLMGPEGLVLAFNRSADW